ncbi:hypothetical protein [Anaeromyxobacter sp. SG26]|uniref:hypothetical protein n=1 Tax=Anaeromyxobacter sp. SG26 TaxID=2925407 RepID=UPI001F57E690|nr:hypothetical protein [Anaeromyxobacter sp. SG26]
MVRIIDKRLRLAYPLGHHLHCLIAQIPNHLRRTQEGWRIADPEGQWRTIRSVLDLVDEGPGNLKKLHFLMLPESCVPIERLDALLDLVAERFRPSTVTMFGLEHVRLRTYRGLLERFKADNAEAIPLVDRDIDSGDVLGVPVNVGCVAVKDAEGRLRVFLEAKTHPFRAEEFLDKYEDQYRGRHFYLFRNEATPFNFMVLVCLDYVYRNLYESNIRAIIDHANQLFFRSRQTLDALFVVQSNPKPEHRVYRDVLSGFYGEYLEDTPGVRDTVTVFGNCSAESVMGERDPGATHGVSSVVLGPHHRLAPVRNEEFSVDDFGGAPVCRLRFGTPTRLYYLNLPQHHEIDPRSSRISLKVHAIFRPGPDGEWIVARPGEGAEPEAHARGESPRGAPLAVEHR